MMFIELICMCTFFQIPATVTRILLNHFKWDKEKLMERFYDGNQEELFSEARVINPFRKAVIIQPRVILNYLYTHSVYYYLVTFI